MSNQCLHRQYLLTTPRVLVRVLVGGRSLMHDGRLGDVADLGGNR